MTTIYIPTTVTIIDREA